MSFPSPEESGAVVLALATLYAIVREILVPMFRKERQERRQEDKVGHFKCEAGKFDQRLNTLEDHDRNDDRRIVTLTEKFEEVVDEVGVVSGKLDVIVERVNWLVASRRSDHA